MRKLGIIVFALRSFYAFCAFFGLAIYYWFYTDEKTAAILDLWFPGLISAVYGIAFFCHAKSLITFFSRWHRHYIKPSKVGSTNDIAKPSKKKRKSKISNSTLQRLYAHISHKIDYGQIILADYYVALLTLREVIEIPLWTYQAYSLSLAVDDPALALLYSIVLATDCIATPFLYRFISDSKTRTIVLEFCDISYDLLLGVILPSFPVARGAFGLMTGTTQLTDTNSNVRTLSAAQLFMIENVVDLLSLLVMPYFWSHLWLSLLEEQIAESPESKAAAERRTTLRNSRIQASGSSEQRDDVAVAPLSSRKTRNERWPRILSPLLFGISIVWGVTVVALSIDAITNTVPCNNVQCSYRTYPWLLPKNSSCPCLIGGIDCKYIQDTLPLENSSQYNTVVNSIIRDSYDKDVLTYFRLYNCHVTQMPPDFAQFKNMFQFAMYNATLVEFQIPIVTFRKLIHIELKEVGDLGPVIPKNLINTPPHCISFTYDLNHLKRFEEPFPTHWQQNLQYATFRGNELTEFPEAFASFESLTNLDLGNNLISSISPSAKFPRVTTLDHNQISFIPNDVMKRSTALETMELDANTALESLEFLEYKPATLKQFFIGNSTLCQSDLLYSTEIDFGCERPICIAGCIKRLVNNLLCNPECNVAACEYDNGECSGKNWSLE